MNAFNSLCTGSSRWVFVNPTFVLVFGLLAGATTGNTDSDVVLSKQPFPPAMIREWTEALTEATPKSFHQIDGLLDRARLADDDPYAWRDYYVYSAAIHAATSGDERRAVALFDEYLERISEMDCSATISTSLLESSPLKEARGVVADYREGLLKRWANYRWSLHNFRADQLGLEYESALSMKCLLSDAVELRAFASQLRQLVPSPEDQCLWNTRDSGLFYASMRLKQLGHSDECSEILKFLEHSDASWPIDLALLQKASEGPATIWVFNRKAVMVSVVLLLVMTIIFGHFYLLTRRSLRGRRADPDIMASRFAVHRSDPFALWVIHTLGISHYTVFALTFLFGGVGLVALSWAEESCWPQSYVVDRAFFDYLSFPYAHALLLPAFFGATIYLYKMIAVKLPSSLALVFGHPNEAASTELPPVIMTSWDHYSKICNSRLLTAVCAAFALAVVLGQKYQWLRDQGTAVVDLRYPGHISLTGIFYTMLILLLVYVVFSCLARGALVLVFVGRLFSRRWRKGSNVQIRLDPGHPDKCAGTRPIGWIMILYYTLLLLLAAQVLINIVEKLRFYESMDIVLANTYFSVFAFAIAFLLTAPVLVGLPLLSVHLAMREYRFEEGIRKGRFAAEWEARLFDKITDGTVEHLDIEASRELRHLANEVREMPLWPFDLKLGLYFALSNALPVLSLVLPFIIESASK